VPKPKNTRLSVFKGREAKLNRAIFQALALKGPQTIYDIHKQIRKQRGLARVKYASVNKRVKVLLESRYIRESNLKETKAGFRAILYDLTFKAYLSIALTSVSPDELIASADEKGALVLLAATFAIGFDCKI